MRWEDEQEQRQGRRRRGEDEKRSPRPSRRPRPPLRRHLHLCVRLVPGKANSSEEAEKEEEVAPLIGEATKG